MLGKRKEGKDCEVIAGSDYERNGIIKDMKRKK